MHLPSQPPSVLPASAAPHRRHNPPRPCAFPPSSIVYSLSSRSPPTSPRHERPSLTYEWRRLVSGNSRYKAIRRASIVCACRRAIVASFPVLFSLFLGSRPSRERERATMILRRVGRRVCLDEFSRQRVIKTLSARRPSRPSAIFSSWNYARYIESRGYNGSFVCVCVMCARVRLLRETSRVAAFDFRSFMPSLLIRLSRRKCAFLYPTCCLKRKLLLSQTCATRSYD